ncbi:hypothetical protein [Sinobaca sp. H24]
MYLGEEGNLQKRIYEDDGETLNHQKKSISRKVFLFPEKVMLFL